MAEVAAIVIVLAAALAIVVRASHGRERAVFLVTGAVGLAASVAALAPRPGAPSPASLPRPREGSLYVSSAACRACHPSEHASFARTYHRTMTQAATLATVLAPLEGPLARRGDEIFAAVPGEPERRVVIATGSHREQVYWVDGERPGELRLLPFVWLVKEARLIPRREAFLTPPEAELPKVHRNSNCIACHATAGEPGHDAKKESFDTRAAELGVACEACHGPGAAHVARHRDPIERYRQTASQRADPTIVQPARLAPARSAAICGQCHAYAFPRDEAAFWTTGYAKAFRAGDALDPSRFLITPGQEAVTLDLDLDSIFWPDGTVRVGGREYNGLVASPCFVRGEGERKLTCLSCHAMHRGDPSGQLDPQRSGDAACASCHAGVREHSHHAAGSAGSSCLGCHMPRTSYALFAATRSHRIEIPNAATTADTGKPNACNLCHLDRSLAWTANRLTSWYGAPPVAGARDVPEGIYEALAGDAAVRVLVADALASREARAATGDAFPGPILRELRVDPYAAVRFVAARTSLDGPALDPALVRSLLAARDTRAITIAE